MKREIAPKAVCGVENLGMAAEVDLCVCFLRGLCNGFDTEPSHCDHQ